MTGPTALIEEAVAQLGPICFLEESVQVASRSLALSLQRQVTMVEATLLDIPRYARYDAEDSGASVSDLFVDPEPFENTSLPIAALECRLRLIVFQCAFREAMLAEEEGVHPIDACCSIVSVIEEAEQDIDDLDYFRLSHYVECWEQCRFLKHLGQCCFTRGRISRAQAQAVLREYGQAGGIDDADEYADEVLKDSKFISEEIGFLDFVGRMAEFDVQYANVHTKFNDVSAEGTCCAAAGQRTFS